MRVLILLVTLFVTTANAGDTVDFTLPDMSDKPVSLSDFRGKLSQRHVPNPWAYTRAQYVRLLVNPENQR